MCKLFSVRDVVAVKFVRFAGDDKEEGVFSVHKQFGNGWSATASNFYVTDKLVQAKTYHDCKAGVSIDTGIWVHITLKEKNDSEAFVPIFNSSNS